ncbi:MAG: hypothetical protein USCAAHI_02776 [Beijerinckiaceae bacterium]|nr:MAG: hypothetical protein USCAAHI_02776 [Beijerinckiaceae bacterium]
MKRSWNNLIKPTSETPHYFAWVDFLRWFAALSVLIWHYQHFYYTSPGKSTLSDPSTQPFFKLFHVFYTYGFNAVQLFWIISGFVFANIYMSTTVHVHIRNSLSGDLLDYILC